MQLFESISNGNREGDWRTRGWIALQVKRRSPRRPDALVARGLPGRQSTVDNRELAVPRTGAVSAHTFFKHDLCLCIQRWPHERRKLRSFRNTRILLSQSAHSRAPPSPRPSLVIDRTKFGASGNWSEGVIVLIMGDSEGPIDVSRWVVFYPIYINSKKTLAEGRRISTSAGVENPNVEEIHDCCNYLKLPCLVEVNPILLLHCVAIWVISHRAGWILFSFPFC